MKLDPFFNFFHIFFPSALELGNLDSVVRNIRKRQKARRIFSSEFVAPNFWLLCIFLRSSSRCAIYVESSRPVPDWGGGVLYKFEEEIVKIGVKRGVKRRRQKRSQA